MFKNIDVDFTNENIIESVVIPTAEKLIQIYKAQGNAKQPDTDGAELYVISRDGAWEILISRNNDKYVLKSLSRMPKNATLINYAGHKSNIFLQGNEDNYFEKAVSAIEDHHVGDFAHADHSISRQSDHLIPREADHSFSRQSDHQN